MSTTSSLGATGGTLLRPGFLLLQDRSGRYKDKLGWEPGIGRLDRITVSDFVVDNAEGPIRINAAKNGRITEVTLDEMTITSNEIRRR